MRGVIIRSELPLNRVGSGICLYFAVVISCMAGDPHIVNGTYVEPAGRETITVRGAEAEFQFQASDTNDERIVRRKYRYALRPNGQIDVIGSSNDHYYVFRILSHGWSWDGTKIVRLDPKTGNRANFERGAMQGRGQ